MSEWTDPRHTAKGKTAKYVGLKTTAPRSTPDSRKRDHARKVSALIRAARELYNNSTVLPDDGEFYAPIDRRGVRRGEFTKRTNAAYVLRDQLTALRTALAALED